MGDGVTTRIQKEFTQLQQELLKQQSEVQQLDQKFDSRFTMLDEKFETMCSDLRGLIAVVKGKGPSTDTPETHSFGYVHSTLDSDGSTHVRMSTRLSYLNAGVNRLFKWECPKFNGDDFKGWISKLEQYFLAVEIPNSDKVRMVMLNLEGKALQWHHYYATGQGGIANLTWDSYLSAMRARFAPIEYDDPMSELVNLKHTSIVDVFHDEFVSVLNQLRLTDSY